ncbi:MAG: hypothetical protein IPO69_02580 [Saprospiraceae bacterium]|nr:hypothetical protein [Saprospiraceae bacterium]
MKIEFGQWQHVMVTYDGSGSARMSIFSMVNPVLTGSYMTNSPDHAYRLMVLSNQSNAP